MLTGEDAENQTVTDGNWSATPYEEEILHTVD